MWHDSEVCHVLANVLSNGPMEGVWGTIKVKFLEEISTLNLIV